MQLTESDKVQIEALVVDLESRCPVQVVASVVVKSGAYPEIPWHAFALGVAFASLVSVLAQYFNPSWHPASTNLVSVVVVMATGLTAALLAVWVPAFARLLLMTHRRGYKLRQYAESQFLARELFNTAERCGVLMQASIFERDAVLLADRGIRARVAQAELDRIAGVMRTALRQGQLVGAFEAGFGALKEVLHAQGMAGPSGGGAISNEVIQTRGEP